MYQINCILLMFSIVERMLSMRVLSDPAVEDLVESLYRQDQFIETMRAIRISIECRLEDSYVNFGLERIFQEKYYHYDMQTRVERLFGWFKTRDLLNKLLEYLEIQKFYPFVFVKIKNRWYSWNSLESRNN